MKRHTIPNAGRLVGWSGLVVAGLLVGCDASPEPDAYGNFEANEVVVAAQASGQLRSFTAQEGVDLPAGAEVGLVDTTQLALERASIFSQSEASRARVMEADRQVGVLQAHRAVAQRAYERTRRLYEQQAATAQQLDQAERDFRVIDAQIAAARAQREGVAQQSSSTDARVRQIRDLVGRSRVMNPVSGTVLATFVHTGEVVQSGQPLYRIANLDTLILRAYVTGSQLPRVRLGQRVQVNVNDVDSLQSLPGTITWVSAKAEFTPTPIQTRDERADLVYAVKISVANPRGLLKIGMPADVTLPTQLDR